MPPWYLLPTDAGSMLMLNAPMFARYGLPDPEARITVPVLAITGEQDPPPMRSECVTAVLGSLCENLTVTPLADSGHYPMQEMPPLTVTLVERFLAGSV